MTGSGSEARQGGRLPSYHRHIMEAIHGPWPCEAKIDEARLVGMKCEPIPRKPLVQNTQNPLGVAEVCERHHGIVGEPDEGTSPVETGPHLVLEPFIRPLHPRS